MRRRAFWNRPGSAMRAAVLLALALLATACGSGDNAGTASPPTVAEDASPTESDEPEEPKDLGELIVQMDWLPNPGYAPVLLAEERGYFEEAGIDATLNIGGAKILPPQLLSSGQADIVVGTLDDVPLGVAEGYPLLAVAVIERLTTASIIVPADSGIETPKDLEGKTIATAAFGSSGVLLRPFLEASGVDVSKVKIENVESQAKQALLVAGNADAITGFSRDEGTRLQVGAGMDVKMFPYSDAGVELLSLGIYTTQEFAEENPELLREATRAILRGYADAANDPQAAVDAAKAAYPEHYDDEDVAVAHAKLLGQYMREQSPKEGFGHMAEEDWENSLDLLQTYFGLTEVQEPSSYYTNEYLPEDDLMEG